MPYRLTLFLFSAFLFLSTSVAAKETLLSSPLAKAFGRQPRLKSVRLSPDGTKVSFIRTTHEGNTVVFVLDLETSKSNPILTNRIDDYDYSNCDWANNTRLLCTALLQEAFKGTYVPMTRIVGVNADGTEVKQLLKREVSGWSQFQSEIVDWLTDDPENVLIQLSEGDGTSVQKLDVYSGFSARVGRRHKQIWDWFSDGQGKLRLYTRIDGAEFRWYASDTEGKHWQVIKSHETADGYPSFSPVGFGEDTNKLYYFDNYKGRTGLFVMDLSAMPPETNRVYTREDVDMGDVYQLGKNQRVVGVSYYLDHGYDYFFDETLESLHVVLGQYFAGKSVAIVDEDWQKQRYIIYVGSDTDAGAYYVYDIPKKKLRTLARLFPSVDELSLSPMRTVRYPAKDLVGIPGYLTLPATGSAPYPTVILPHGGPSSRDIKQFDFLVQYLAAKGYAVLQSNYRGSSGFGTQWHGDGAFKGWRQAVSDIIDGADYLIEEGIAQKDSVCIVGWSYGGYASLMSAIEAPGKFKCVGSIAGVTDPKDLRNFQMGFVGGAASREFIGTDDEVLIQGSPLKRVNEIQAPVFLVHPYKDSNVPFRQTKRLAKALKKAKVDSEFIQYKHAQHSIRPERYRIDMLTRLGQFLDKHIGPQSVSLSSN